MNRECLKDILQRLEDLEHNDVVNGRRIEDLHQWKEETQEVTQLALDKITAVIQQLNGNTIQVNHLSEQVDEILRILRTHIELAHKLATCPNSHN